MSTSYEWTQYYDEFTYFSSAAVRDGCEPRVMLHPTPSSRAIVLVHGLTDSPYFMEALGLHFHKHLGYDVYMPLLHCHGLKEPNGMKGVKLHEWKRNVEFAVTTAAESAQQVSIGGLSTGGTLSFYNACENNSINGQLYLFSAALDLAGGKTGLFGEAKEILGRTFVAGIIDKFKSQELIGENPFRYSHIDMDGARELALLISETDDLLSNYNSKNIFPIPVLAAHSEFDSTASIKGVKTLQKKCHPDLFKPHYIEKSKAVEHASVVLAAPVIAKSTDKILEKANPCFAELIDDITLFDQSFVRVT